MGQFSALVSFAYNVGVPRFATSTLLRRLNRADYEGAAAEFERWIYAAGRKLPGLVRRRLAERNLFEMPDDPPGALRLSGLNPLPPVRVEPSPLTPVRSLNPRLS
jgi:lysozyme